MSKTEQNGAALLLCAPGPVLRNVGLTLHLRMSAFPPLALNLMLVDPVLVARQAGEL